MKVTYSQNNLTDVTAAVEKGERKLEISFDHEGELKDLPSVYVIPERIIHDRPSNSIARFYLDVNHDKEPVEWRIGVGEQPL